ncbi:TPA_asm: DUF340 domain-containing protein [Salmonella enterica subsp. enterica serovar Mbandaka]|uniref:lysine exporter LysO family protein n=1 Tax=Enterobacteriaceae TaxID=543 RepID=UPI00182E283F|nr:lysine exporter LysO family protein [Klebsiella variicola]HAB5395124.1 DUF340 domain-containing protein [Salmonella enterica subsp. enterica serovar Mbandaka]
MNILASLLPIIAALLAGYALGKMLPERICKPILRLLSPLVWALLFLIGFEFGEVISSANSIGAVMKAAVIFSLCTTAVPCLLIVLCRTRQRQLPTNARQPFRLSLVWPPLKECIIALSMVALGGMLYPFQERMAGGSWALPSSSMLLLLLILLVGIDLTQIKLEARWFSRSILVVPASVVIGSLLGGVIAAWMTGESIKVSLALSSGFGWFTLSSVMIGDALGQTYGTMALMTDLFRELLAIVVLYALGRYQPQISIGSAGATALDSTLPIIKQACSPDAVPLALISGFLLTLLAPVFISAILT